MPTLDTFAASRVHKVLIYGPPKSGKTVLAGKLAASGYVLDYLNIENGKEALLNPKNLPIAARKNVNVLELPDTPERPCAAETTVKILKAMASVTPQTLKICTAHGKVDCALCAKEPTAEWSIFDTSLYSIGKRIAIIDSWTQFRQSVLQIVFGTAKLEEPAQGDAKALQQWGKVTNYINAAAGYIQASRCNLIVISHEELVEMEDKKTKLVPVGGTTNFSKSFAKHFDDVIYVEVSGGKHVALSSTTARPNIVTGSRAGHDTSTHTKDNESALLGIFAS